MPQLSMSKPISAASEHSREREREKHGQRHKERETCVKPSEKGRMLRPFLQNHWRSATWSCEGGHNLYTHNEPIVPRLLMHAQHTQNTCTHSQPVPFFSSKGVIHNMDHKWQFAWSLSPFVWISCRKKQFKGYVATCRVLITSFIPLACSTATVICWTWGERTSSIVDQIPLWAGLLLWNHDSNVRSFQLLPPSSSNYKCDQHLCDLRLYLAVSLYVSMTSLPHRLPGSSEQTPATIKPKCSS